MPNPKRRHSKTRGAKRRTHYTVSAMASVACKNCGAPVLPHRACAACGHYKGRQVVAVRQDAD
jgi:large subunit ribosomal protein L32